MDSNELKQISEKLKNLILPEKDILLKIISQTKNILKKEPNVLRISGDTNIIGDIHGQFFDFLNIFELANPNAKFLFLGDYVDRGYNSTELIIMLMILKILKNDQIFLIRGNHENRSQSNVYGFKNECVSKYDYFIYWKLCEVFEFLPMCAIVNDIYFCVHGGISPNLSIDYIDSMDRIEEFSEISAVLWGDPTDQTDYFLPSQRGAGYIFGQLAFNEFLKRNNFKYLIRSHQLVLNGIHEEFECKCITVWSAPNYCYKCKNRAAIIKIEGKKHNYVFFEAVEHQYKL